MTDGSKASFETVLEALGKPGRFQLTQIFFTLLSKTLLNFAAFSYVFLGYSPPHVCNHLNEKEILAEHGFANETSAKFSYGSCQVTIYTNHSGDIREQATVKCLNGRNFSDAKDTTILAQWDLVCESVGVADLTQTLFVLGQVIGGLLLSHFPDKYGRKPIMIISCISKFILESLVTAAPNIHTMYVIKLLSGVAYQAFNVSFFIHNMELLVTRHRQIYAVLQSVLFVTSGIVMAGIAYLLRNQNWRYLQGTIGAVGITSFFMVFLLDESPRWLVANGRLKDTLTVLRKACKQNKKDFEEIRQIVKELIEVDPPQTENTGRTCRNKLSNEKQSVMVLFRDKRVFLITAVTCYLWMVSYLVYYGLFLMSSAIAGDRFLDFIAMLVSELPSHFIVVLLLGKLKRRAVLVIFYVVTLLVFSVSSLLYIFEDASKNVGYISTALLITGKVAIGCIITVLQIITPELFPTNLRSTGNGFCNTLGRAGAMASSHFRSLFFVAHWLPVLIYTVTCGIALCLVWFLPETTDLSENFVVSKIGQSEKNKLVQK